MTDQLSFVFITRQYWSGVLNCLQNIESVIKEMYPGARTKFFAIGQTGFHLQAMKFLKANPPNFLFVGGWDVAIKTILLNTNEKTTTILKWCSPITQTELGGELDLFKEVWNFASSGKINYVGMGIEEDVKTLDECSNGTFIHLPVYLSLSEELQAVEADTNVLKEGINCDIFCAPNPRKNIFAQLSSLSYYKNETTLHTNFNASHNKSYCGLADLVLSNVIDHGWLSRDRYLSVIKAMDFAMQVTLSESLNYVAVEHMNFEVPVLISEALPLAKSSPELKELIVRRPESLTEIKEKLHPLVNDSSFRKEMGKLSKIAFVRYNTASKDILKNSIKRIIES